MLTHVWCVIKFQINTQFVVSALCWLLLVTKRDNISSGGDMRIIYLLALLGLAMAKTNPRDFADLCTSGECPAGWREVDGDCVLFMSGWDEARAREECRENRAEYMEYVMMKFDSDSVTRHPLPVCVVK